MPPIAENVSVARPSVSLGSTANTPVYVMPSIVIAMSLSQQCTPAGVHCCDSDMAITIDGMTYTGVFAVLPRETDGRATLTFSAIGGNQAIWGARIEG